MKYGFVYIWFDAKRKMFYIGCHWGYEKDGYICSSKRMLSAYRRRPNDFKRRILKNGIMNRTDLLSEEFKWLSLIKDNELNKKYYNKNNHHFHHWCEKKDFSGKNHPMYGKTHTVEAKQKISIKSKGRIPWNKGKTNVYSDETLRKMGESCKGKTWRINSITGKREWI